MAYSFTQFGQEFATPESLNSRFNEVIQALNQIDSDITPATLAQIQAKAAEKLVDAAGLMAWFSSVKSDSTTTNSSNMLASSAAVYALAQALASGLSGKAAASHSHAIADTTGLQAALDGKAAASHSHAIAGVTGLEAALDGKAAASHSHAIADTTGLQAALDGKAAASHSHAIAGVTGLQAALDGKAAASHSHAIADTTGLQAALDGKAAASHSHAIADVTGLEAALAAGGVDFTPVLLWDRDVGGSLSESFRNFSFVLIEYTLSVGSETYRDYIYVPESVIVTGSSSVGTKINRMIYNSVYITARFSNSTTLTYVDYESNAGGEYFNSAMFTKVWGIVRK